VNVAIELLSELTVEIMRDHLVLESVRSYVPNKLDSVFWVLWIDFCVLAVKCWYFEADAKVIHEFLFIFGCRSCNISLIVDASLVQSGLHSI